MKRLRILQKQAFEQVHKTESHYVLLGYRYYNQQRKVTLLHNLLLTENSPCNFQTVAMLPHSPR